MMRSQLSGAAVFRRVRAVEAPRASRLDAGRFTLLDAGMLALIVAAGALPFIFYQRGDSFYSGDMSYLELARSIAHHSYGFNFRRETMLPPGFPAILAVLAAAFGDSHAVMLRSMAVFATLGLGASYLLLRREQGRAFAATVTGMLLLSPTLFRISTTIVFSDLPYLFTSMAALLVASQLDAASRPRNRRVLTVVCGFFLIASLLIRSAGLMLFAGMAVWLAVSFLRDRQKAIARCRTFVPLLMAGLVVQAGWMYWIKANEAPAEWPIGGYPQSYTSQLRIINGNEPELGMATVADLPRRVEENLSEQAAGLVDLATGKGGRLPHSWFAPWVVAPVLLILVGLITSVWRTGGKLQDWYFVAHEGMYLLWPWNFEMRFVLPVVPLACLYLWRGIRILTAWSIRKPRAAMVSALSIAGVCGASAFALAQHSSGLRSQLAFICWLLFALSVILVGRWRQRVRERAPLSRLLNPKSRLGLRFAGVAALVILFGLDAKTLVGLGKENLAFDVTHEQTYPQILAAEWIHQHTPQNSVVMARQMDVVYHYAGRRVVWFPPITDPAVLYEGIRRHQVSFVVVFDRGSDTYWRPAEEDCFEPLLRQYPSIFRLVQEGPREKIYAVVGEEPME